MKAQSLVYWLEEGRGAAVLRWVGLLALGLALTATLGYKRLSGPQGETLEQAVVGKALAEGRGFSTPVIWPQAAAVLETQSGQWPEPGTGISELYQPPGYPLVIGGTLKVAGGEGRAWLFSGDKRRGARSDLLLYALNAGALWLACGLAGWLAWRLHGRMAGWLAALGMAVSGGLWSAALAVDGAAFLTALAAGALCAGYGFTGAQRRRAQAGWAAALGGVTGLMFLLDYVAGLFALAALGWVLWTGEKRTRWLSGLAFVTLFGMLAGPWVGRNLALTGHPLALAGQEIALRAGDPTAEPTTIRATLSAQPPEVSVRKVGHKWLDSVADTVGHGLWAGGAAVFAGLFLVGLVYRPRRERTYQLRWLAIGAGAAVLVLSPPLVSGGAERTPTVWLVPLLVVFGSVFFAVLLESLGGGDRWRRWLWGAGLLGVQALPLVALLLPPAEWRQFAKEAQPPLMLWTGEVLQPAMTEGYVAMADAPAALAWYGGWTQVYGQPATYADFEQVQARHPVGLLYLTPLTLEKPYFDGLANRDVKSGVESRRSWGTVYRGLAQERLPAFFPLPFTVDVPWSGVRILLNPRAFPNAGEDSALRD